MQKIGKTLRDALEKRPKTSKNGHLIPYNPVLRLLSEKPSILNNAHYCPLESCKNLGRSLRVGEKAKKVKEHLFYPYSPTIQDQKFFQKNHLTQTKRFIVLYNHAKNWEDPYGHFGKNATKVEKNNRFWTLNPI